MKTAQQWYVEMTSYSNYKDMNNIPREWFLKKINEARKEAIEECAERVDVKENYNRAADSILSLINELK